MKKILFVDDEPELLALFEHVGGSFDHRVVFARSVRDGIEALKTHEIGLIICDYFMPQRKGIELLRHVRNENLQCAFYYYTGAEAVDIPVEPNPDGVFLKPDAGKVVKLMRDYLSLKSDSGLESADILSPKG